VIFVPVLMAMRYSLRQRSKRRGGREKLRAGYVSKGHPGCDTNRTGAMGD